MFVAYTVVRRSSPRFLHPRHLGGYTPKGGYMRAYFAELFTRQEF